MVVVVDVDLGIYMDLCGGAHWAVADIVEAAAGEAAWAEDLAGLAEVALVVVALADVGKL